MTINLRNGLAAVLMTAALTANAELTVPSGEYTLDKSHGYITISYSHLGFSNPHVGFDEFEVELDLDADQPENSTLDVVINARAVDSRVEEFNEHLNGEQFFDTENHPTITFKSTNIEHVTGHQFKVSGDLTIKDVTKPVVLDATINKAAEHPMRKVPTLGISASGKVLRSDWGLSRAVPYVSDEVTIDIDVELPMNKDS